MVIYYCILNYYNIIYLASVQNGVKRYSIEYFSPDMATYTKVVLLKYKNPRDTHIFFIGIIPTSYLNANSCNGPVIAAGKYFFIKTNSSCKTVVENLQPILV